MSPRSAMSRIEHLSFECWRAICYTGTGTKRPKYGMERVQISSDVSLDIIRSEPIYWHWPY